MPYFQFTEKEYQALIQRLDELKENVSPRERNPKEIIYDNADVLRILKVSRRTLMSWRSEGLISFSQIGSKLYYTQESINEFIQRHYQKRFA